MKALASSGPSSDEGGVVGDRDGPEGEKAFGAWHGDLAAREEEVRDRTRARHHVA